MPTAAARKRLGGCSGAFCKSMCSFPLLAKSRLQHMIAVRCAAAAFYSSQAYPASQAAWLDHSHSHDGSPQVVHSQLVEGRARHVCLAQLPRRVRAQACNSLHTSASVRLRLGDCSALLSVQAACAAPHQVSMLSCTGQNTAVAGTPSSCSCGQPQRLLGRPQRQRSGLALAAAGLQLPAAAAL